MLKTIETNLDELIEGILVEDRRFMFDVDEGKAFKKLAKKQTYRYLTEP